MKKEEKIKARDLRSIGWSINDIKDELKVSKGTVSLWVRDIELTQSQKEKLNLRGLSKEAIEKRRVSRLANAKAKRQLVIETAKNEIKEISLSDLFFIGVSLYWGEGSKTSRGQASLANSDPRIIKIMMRFFKEICHVPEDKFRGHINLHPHLDKERAEKYWHKISGIPLEQFFKTSQTQSKASKNKKDSLPFGTFTICVCNTALYLKIMGWMEGLHDKIVSVKQV